MASAGSKALWSDITSLFSSLNTGRSKFGYSTVSATGGSVGSTITTSPLSTLKSFISEMKSNRWLSSLDISSLSIPSVGTLIYASQINTWANVISNLNNTCAFDANNFGFGFNSSFNSNNFGFGFNSNFNSGDFGFGFNSNNFGFDSSYASFSFGGNYNFDSSYASFSFGGNYGFDSSYASFGFGSNYGFDSGNFGFHIGDFSFSI